MNFWMTLEYRGQLSSAHMRLMPVCEPRYPSHHTLYPNNSCTIGNAEGVQYRATILSVHFTAYLIKAAVPQGAGLNVSHRRKCLRSHGRLFTHCCFIFLTLQHRT